MAYPWLRATSVTPSAPGTRSVVPWRPRWPPGPTGRLPSMRRTQRVRPPCAGSAPSRTRPSDAPAPVGVVARAERGLATDVAPSSTICGWSCIRWGVHPTRRQVMRQVLRVRQASDGSGRRHDERDLAAADPRQHQGGPRAALAASRYLQLPAQRVGVDGDAALLD